MRAKNYIKGLMVLCLIPLLLANKNCDRSTTWGEKYFTKWESDHVDIDAETRCIDCHDDITSPKVKPKNHDLSWVREHGSFSGQKAGFKNENVCYQCHTEAQCTSCHMQEEPDNHTEFWRERGHGVSVSLDRSKCTTCHVTTEFCERCHNSVQPRSHNAAWGNSTNIHCNNCHFPVNAIGSQECNVCHKSTPSHNSTPNMPSNALHFVGANCRDCHRPLRHPDNGSECTSCHR